MKLLQVTIVLGMLIAAAFNVAQGYYVPQMFQARASRMNGQMLGKGGPSESHFADMNDNERNLIRIIHYLENVGRRRR